MPKHDKDINTSKEIQDKQDSKNHKWSVWMQGPKDAKETTRKFKNTTPGQVRDYKHFVNQRRFQKFEQVESAQPKNEDAVANAVAHGGVDMAPNAKGTKVFMKKYRVDGRTKEYREASRRIKERQEKLAQRQVQAKLDMFGVHANPFAEETENKKYLETKPGSIEDAVLQALNPNAEKETLTLPKKEEEVEEAYKSPLDSPKAKAAREKLQKTLKDIKKKDPDHPAVQNVKEEEVEVDDEYVPTLEEFAAHLETLEGEALDEALDGLDQNQLLEILGTGLIKKAAGAVKKRFSTQGRLAAAKKKAEKIQQKTDLHKQKQSNIAAKAKLKQAKAAYKAAKGPGIVSKVAKKVSGVAKKAVVTKPAGGNVDTRNVPGRLAAEYNPEINEVLGHAGWAGLGNMPPTDPKTGKYVTGKSKIKRVPYHKDHPLHRKPKKEEVEDAFDYKAKKGEIAAPGSGSIAKAKKPKASDVNKSIEQQMADARKEEAEIDETTIGWGKSKQIKKMKFGKGTGGVKKGKLKDLEKHNKDLRAKKEESELDEGTIDITKLSLAQRRALKKTHKIVDGKLVKKRGVSSSKPKSWDQFGKYASKAYEEVEIDELSNKTMDSYAQKASASQADAEKKGDYKKADKRIFGKLRATRRKFSSDTDRILKGLKKESKEAEAGERDVGSDAYADYVANITPGEGITNKDAKKADVSKKKELAYNAYRSTKVDETVEISEIDDELARAMKAREKLAYAKQQQKAAIEHKRRMDRLGNRTSRKEKSSGIAAADANLSQKEEVEVEEEVKFKVKLTGLPVFYVDGKSVGEIKQNLRKKLKRPNDDIESIERVTTTAVKKDFRSRVSGNKDRDMDGEVDEIYSPKKDQSYYDDNEKFKKKNPEKVSVLKPSLKGMPKNMKAIVRARRKAKA